MSYYVSKQRRHHNVTRLVFSYRYECSASDGSWDQSCNAAVMATYGSRQLTAGSMKTLTLTTFSDTFQVFV